MNFTIAFRNLPFTPAKDQVIYIENEYNEWFNTYIKQHYSELKSLYEDERQEFVYLPMITADEDLEEKVRYYAPYLKSDIVRTSSLRNDLLLSYMYHPENRDKIPPSLIWFEKREGDKYIFRGRSIGVPSQLEPEVSFPEIEFSLSRPTRLSEELREVKASPIPRQPSVPLPDGVRYSRIPMQDVSQEQETSIDDIDVEEAIRQLESSVARLKMKGVTLAAIHEMIDKHEKLSRMVITPDYRIFLPDYGNLEIKMTPIVKAYYFLFLRYPKGIRIKELPDYSKELYVIYKQLKPNFEEAKLAITITKMTNPFSNRINEAISLVRAAFLSEFDEHLSQHYFITGTAGEKYKITLDRDLIEWQEEE